MPDRHDEELRGAFGLLKAQDRSRIPDFGSVMARARQEAERSGSRPVSKNRRPRRFPLPVAWGASLLAAASVGALLFTQRPATSDADFVQVVEAFSTDPAAGAWRSPTDRLLDLPGWEILSTVPSPNTSRLLSFSASGSRRNQR